VIDVCDPVACTAAGCVPTLCTGAGVASNDVMFERSSRVIPGGVNSSIRAFKSVGGRPYVVARAEGAHVWDVEGTRRIDLVQSYGAVILGHAHPAITSAVAEAAKGGTSYGAPTPREMKLAETISERVPSCEQVRFMNSGTEATSTAVRLARGYTGRDRVVIFHGNFHGATDALLAAGGSGVATLGLPGTAGVPAGAVAETLVVPYNVVPTLDETVACVIVEPVAANMGVVAPVPGFLPGLRTECDRVGAVLVFDEVITGFRLGNAGAQGEYGVRPDLTTFGKVIGGGLPIGAAPDHGDALAVGAGLPRRNAGRQPDRHRCRSGRPRSSRRGAVRAAASTRRAVGVDVGIGVCLGRVRRPLSGRRHPARHVLQRRTGPH
jgi:glutamate-1-semialdehyde 2,1-aminomutase